MNPDESRAGLTVPPFTFCGWLDKGRLFGIVSVDAQITYGQGGFMGDKKRKRAREEMMYIRARLSQIELFMSTGRMHKMRKNTLAEEERKLHTRKEKLQTFLKIAHWNGLKAERRKR